MYSDRFNVSFGKVSFVDPNRRFVLVITSTPNGTDTPNEEAFIAWLEKRVVAQTALDIEDAELNEHAHFTGPRIGRLPKKGDELMYRTVTKRTWVDSPFHELETWCYADEFHGLRSRMPELRYLAPNGRRHFHHLLDLMRQITEDGLEIPSNVTWQTRPGSGTNRGYGGCIEGEVEMGWEDCPDPRLGLKK
ncbi:MAG: hypothetical protein QG626_36 [Patescibacteria group bacterium]|jgi:hypothetical protein|nr:hypothetical protein [Patescibacteria group bacterium]